MTVSSITKITDHQEAAIDRLPQQYKDATKKYTWSDWPAEPGPLPNCTGWEGMLLSLLKPAQELEDVMYEMLTERSLLTSEGDGLDRIGEIVGVGRGGLSDANYLSFILAQIAANNSDTTAANLYGILDIFLADTLITRNLREHFPAKVTLDYQSDVAVAVTTANNEYSTTISSSTVDRTIPVGTYYPGELRAQLSTDLSTYAGETITVDFSAERKFTMHITGTALTTLTFDSCYLLFGMSYDGQSITTTTTGAAIDGTTFSKDNIQSALLGGKAAGVDLSSQPIDYKNHFGFDADTEALGFSVIDGSNLKGGGTYSTLLT